MPSEPPLSIIIPSHSRTDLLTRCLTATTAHAPPLTEVIVVDDGSIECCVSRVAERFPCVRVLRHTKPLGFCQAVNAGIAAAGAAIVELLNDDAEPTAGWANAALAAFANERVAAVAPLVLRHGRHGPIIDSAGDDYDRGGFARSRFRNHPLAAIQPADLRPCTLTSVSACAAFYRRRDLLAVGGFPVSFRAYFDDVDVSQRLRRAGRTLRFVPDSVVWHYGSATHGPPRRRMLIEQQSRNEEWLFWRNRGPGDLPRHAAVIVGKALIRMGQGTFGPWLAGRIRAVLASPA